MTNELRDTDLIGPTRLGWLEEATDLWRRRSEYPGVDPWWWVAISLECLQLLKRRDDEVAELLQACKDAQRLCGELKGGIAANVLHDVIARFEEKTP